MLSIDRLQRLFRRGPEQDHVLVIRPWKVAYFRVPKAANTSVKRAIARALKLPKLSGVPIARDRYWRAVAPRVVGMVALRQFESDPNYASYWSFAVVREPLSRLVSAYKNKILRKPGSIAVTQAAGLPERNVF